MSSIMERMKKASFVESAAALSASEFFKGTDLIRMPVHLMNVAFSGTLDGGFMRGLHQLAGPSKHFKSNMALVLCKAFQDTYKDGIILFYDSEFGATPEYFETAGIDNERVFHIPITNIEELNFDLNKKLDELTKKDKVMIFVDSIGNLASKKEVEDVKNEKSVGDMTRAKTLKSLFRIVTPKLTTKDIPMVCINHTYDTQELYSKKVVSGGCLVEGTVLRMADGSLRAIEQINVGEFVTTLSGPKEVTHVWNPDTLTDGEPECVEVELDDGCVVTCSYNHPFLVRAHDGSTKWVKAIDLEEGADIVTV